MKLSEKLKKYSKQELIEQSDRISDTIFVLELVNILLCCLLVVNASFLRIDAVHVLTLVFIPIIIVSMFSLCFVQSRVNEEVRNKIRREMNSRKLKDF